MIKKLSKLFFVFDLYVVLLFLGCGQNISGDGVTNSGDGGASEQVEGSDPEISLPNDPETARAGDSGEGQVEKTSNIFDEAIYGVATYQ